MKKKEVSKSSNKVASVNFHLSGDRVNHALAELTPELKKALKTLRMKYGLDAVQLSINAHESL